MPEINWRSKEMKKQWSSGERKLPGFLNHWKGKKRSSEDREKMRIAKIGNKNALGHHKTDEAKKVLSVLARKQVGEKAANTVAYQRILDEIPGLEKQGFRCIPIGKVIPDLIAIKDGKVYAVEIERRDPNYAKYTAKIRKYYDDVMWILRKK